MLVVVENKDARVADAVDLTQSFVNFSDLNVHVVSE